MGCGVTRRARPSVASKTYRITDAGGPNIDPVVQLGGRFPMRLHPRGDPAERRQAARTVACNATTADGRRWADTAEGAAPGPYAADTRMLLDALGLDTPDQET